MEKRETKLALTTDLAIDKSSNDSCRLASDQLAPTLRYTSFDCNRNPVDSKGIGSSNNLVDAVQLAPRVDLRTIDLIPQPRNRAAADVMVGRTADDGSAVIGLIADRDYS